VLARNRSARILDTRFASYCNSIDSLAPAHSGIRRAHCAALGAGSELVALVLNRMSDVVSEAQGRCVNRNSWIVNRGTPSPACSPRRPRRVNLFRLKRTLCRLHDQQELAALSTVIDRRYKADLSTAILRPDWHQRLDTARRLQQNAIAAIVMLYVIHV